MMFKYIVNIKMFTSNNKKYFQNLITECCGNSPAINLPLVINALKFLQILRKYDGLESINMFVDQDDLKTPAKLIKNFINVDMNINPSDKKLQFFDMDKFESKSNNLVAIFAYDIDRDSFITGMGDSSIWDIFGCHKQISYLFIYSSFICEISYNKYFYNDKLVNNIKECVKKLMLLPNQQDTSIYYYFQTIMKNQC